MKKRYEMQVEKIQGSKMNPLFRATVVAYSLMIVGLCVFVIPHILRGKISHNLKVGALFGLVVYGIYDFTNMAVFKDWDKMLAIIDVIWGMFVYSVSAIIGSVFKNS